jgi:predicted LPLAT superfamily acyltransferase
MKESDTQRQILHYLALKRIFHYRNNSGAFVDSQRHFYRFGAVGSPDMVYVVNGQYVGIEVKAPKGKQSEHQKEFQKQLEVAGGRYILAHSLDDVINERL